ncbi:MAG: J domain-containing protein, partial [Deltaproteobacteria bacterium]|nr:J domain-containing protein [Deltaproteobacteria bacterium]
KIPKKGVDIHEFLRIRPQQAMQGGPYAYYLKKNSKKLIVKIPPGIRDGQRIRLKNMGESGKAGGEPGDLYLKIIIKKSLFDKIKTAAGSMRK